MRIHALTVRKIAVGVGLVLLGMVITLAGLFALVATSEKPNLEDIQREYALDYTKRQQSEIGVNCTTFPKEFIALLETIDQKVLSPRKAGENWRPLVTEAIEADLKKYSEFAFACRQIYVTGQKGTINNLQHLWVLDEITTDFILLKIYLRHGPGKNCDAGCRDEKFEELRKAHAETIKKLRQAQPPAT